MLRLVNFNQHTFVAYMSQYWAGKLDLHNLEGYGVDVFLQ